MKKVLFTLFVLLAVVTVHAQRSIVFYGSNVEALLAKAKKENKYVFIDTYTPTCPPCKKMDRIFAKQAVAQFFNDNFINIKVHMNKSDDAVFLRTNYKMVFLPTMLILDPDGNQVYRIEEAISESELLKAGDRALHPEKYRAQEIALAKKNARHLISTSLGEKLIDYTLNNLHSFTPEELREVTNIARNISLQDRENIEYKNNLLRLYMASNRCTEAKTLARQMAETDMTLAALNNCN